MLRINQGEVSKCVQSRSERIRHIPDVFVACKFLDTSIHLHQQNRHDCDLFRYVVLTFRGQQILEIQRKASEKI